MLRPVATMGLAASVLSACYTPLEMSGPAKTASLRNGPPQERVLGTASSYIRTYHINAEGERVEIGGAQCTVRSAHFSAKVVSPQEVVYPSFLQADRFKDRGNPGPVKVICKGSGKSGELTVQATPANMSMGVAQTQVYAQYSDGTTSLAGGSFTAPMYSKQLASSYPWKYAQTIIVDLTP
jgi:hypothetical protein